MKKLLLVALMLIAASTTVQAEDQVVMFCRLDVPGDVIFILQNDPDTDLWSVSEVAGAGTKKQTYPATRVGISTTGVDEKNMEITLYFPLAKGDLVVSALKKGYDVTGNIKELDHGQQTNYRECMPNGMRFYFNNKALQSENLTHVD